MNGIKMGARIAALRRDRGLTQLDLAEKLGITDRAISKWETDGGYPDITLLPAIADLLGVSLDYLLRGKPRTMQRLEIFHPEGGRSRTVEAINEKYLSQGWQVASVTLAGCGDGLSCGAVVVQKDVYDE